MTKRLPTLLLLSLAGLLAAACSDSSTSSGSPGGPGGPGQREPCAEHDLLRHAYFGDLHVHTLNSFDAYVFGARATPVDAYRFARGEPIVLPPLDASGRGTRTVRLTRPLDFVAVTDHSEYLGEVELCSTPGSPEYDSPSCQAYRGEAYHAVVQFAAQFTKEEPKRAADICGAGDATCRRHAGTVWQRVIDAAEGAYDRTAACRFTSFIAYEYTNVTAISTRHRNVIFKNDRVPFPTSYFEQQQPQGLWQELRAACIDAGTGCDALAIPHNSNESNGRMFLVEYPGASSIGEEREQARLRARMEPLLEIFQHKGDSECMNGLSGIVGAPDEQCEFEKHVRPGFGDCGDTPGNGGAGNNGCYSRHDFLRGALVEGLKEWQRLGVNPYPLGVIASTDTHNGTPGYVDEDTFAGHRGTDDDTPERRMGPGVLTAGGIAYDPGGLAAVWAEENSRASIFDALRRRETFGTSGPRIAVRFFGGWDLPEGLCDDPDMVRQGYEHGVPMGSVLARPAAQAPRFVASALRDPGVDGKPGTPLQRLQVIKGWIDGGQAHQRVYEIAGNPDNGATVDTSTCTPQGPGADSLCGAWTDPDFEPAQPAFYYVRAIENPTCRWSTWECNRLHAGERPPACSDPAVAKTLQERAWTSPIFYEPAA